MRRLQRTLIRARLARRVLAARRFAQQPEQAPRVGSSQTGKARDPDAAKAIAELEAAIAALEGADAAREALAS